VGRSRSYNPGSEGKSLADDLLTLLFTRVLVSDGAMGTMLYASGVSLDRPLPELNVSRPELVRAIHGAYLTAGSDILQTNTFGAHRYSLARHGMDERVREINLAGVRIAREVRDAAAASAMIAGAVSPIGGAAARNRLGHAGVTEGFQEQIAALVEGGVDLLLFETFGDLAELLDAIRVARSISSLPVIAQMTFIDDGQTLSGDRPDEVARALDAAGADVIGANCTLGPQGLLQVIRQLAVHTARPLSAQPNAGQPILIDGRFQYPADADYFASYARRLVEQGVAVIGGCCGTTPHYIEAIAREVTGMALPPSRRAGARIPETAEASVAPAGSNASPFAERIAARRFVIACEVRPPAGGDAEATLADAQRLKEAGAEAIAIAAPSSPRAQLSPITLAVLVQQRVQVDTVLTVTTWDKSLASLQADLLGAYAFGLRNVICRTGNPPAHGTYPNIGGIWDVDSLGLIGVLRALNDGRDSNGVPIGKPTSFLIGTRVNSTGKVDDAEYDFARRKVAAGAHFVTTPPVFDVPALLARLASIGAGNIPVLIGVLPLRDYEHAEYLKYEVPEIWLPDVVLDRMRAAGPRGSEVGREIAREVIVAAQPHVAGILLTADAPPDEMLPLLRSLPT
jgi:methionine synthase / methylenetetrahydrofolate reductase(NADPH)